MKKSTNFYVLADIEASLFKFEKKASLLEEHLSKVFSGTLEHFAAGFIVHNQGNPIEKSCDNLSRFCQ